MSVDPVRLPGGSTRLSRGDAWALSRFAVRIVVVCAVAGASLVAVTAPSMATAGASLTADVQVSAGPHVGSTTQAGVGDTVKYKYTLDPGTATNPAHSTTIALTGPQTLNPSSVQAPGGTTVSYSTDGQTFTPSPTGAKFLRFTGGLASGGDGVATAVSGPLTTFPTAVGGDGYTPIMTSTRVLNVWHHSGGGGKVDCHVIATGASCAGYPFQNQVGGANVKTGQAAVGAIDPANPTHLWYAGQRNDAGHTLEIGFNCTDITEGQAPASCGWVTAGTTASSGGASRLNSGGLANGKFYAIDVSGLVYCVDPAANAGAGAACGANPINLSLPAGTSDYALELTVIPGGTRLIARTNTPTNSATARSHLACVDAATDAPCAGWGAGSAGVRDVDNTPNNGSATYGFTINGDVIPVQTTGTTWDAFCGSRNNNDRSSNLVTLDLACYNLADGTLRANPPGLNDVLPDVSAGWFFGTDSYGGMATFGHRVYFVMFDYNWSDDTAVCYDYAANNGAGGVCENYPYRYAEDKGGQASNSLNLYGVALDATGSCLWGYGDGRQFVAGTSVDPSKGCSSATTSATTLPVTPTTSFCGVNSSGAAWGAITLRDLSVSDYTSASVTVNDGTGTPVGGFNAIALPPGQSIDISSIPKSGSTASLSVSVAFTGINNAAFAANHAVLETTWSTATKPAVCFTTAAATPTCASGQSLSATASTVLSDVAHSANVALSATNALASTDSAPGTPCPSAAPLTSTGTTGSPQTVTVPVPASGSVTLLGGVGQPVTTRTLPGVGTYDLDPGTGIITFTPVTAYTGQAAPVSYRITDTNGQTAISTYTPTVTAAPAPSPAPTPAALYSTGAGPTDQHVTVPLPAGHTLALLQAGQPVSAVTVTGVGTYTLNSTTHVITFTPVSGFVGTPSGVTFQVTDASNRSGTALYTPTVTKPEPPTAVAVTSTGPAVQHATIAHQDGQSVSLLDAAGDPTAGPVTIAGEGTYVLDPTTAVITFTPVAGFTGTGVGVGFRVSDGYGQHALAAYTPTVQIGVPPTPTPTPTPPAPEPEPKPLPKIDRSDLVKIPANPKKVTGKEKKTKAFNSSYTGIDAYPISKLGARHLAEGEAATLSGDGLFDFDKAKLTKSGRAQVKAVVFNLEDSKNIRCEGYTDYAGARDHEMDLSLRRAKAICTALKVYGANVTTQTKGYGPQRPVVVGGTAKGRKENRRVVILVTK